MRAATRFCLAAGGLALLPLMRVSLITAVVAASLAAAYFFGVELIDRFFTVRPPRALTAAHAFTAAALTVYAASRLVTESGVMDRGFYPLILLITAALAFYAASERGDGVPRLALIVCAFSALVLSALLFLCLIRSGFSPPYLGRPDPTVLFAVFALSVSDGALFPRGAAGGLAAHAFMLVMTLVCVCVLGAPLFEESETPWLLLWSSTYIPSFLNSFEAAGVCAFYALAAVRACLLLRAAKPNGSAPLVLFAILLTLLSLSRSAVLICLAICAVCGLITPLCIKKSP